MNKEIIYLTEVELVFDNWETNNNMLDSSVLNEASNGSFHSGTCFNANLFLKEEEIEDLQEQMKKGLRPKFTLFKRIVKKPNGKILSTNFYKDFNKKGD